MIILSSASRIVLIIMVIALCIFTYLWKVEWKDFIQLCTVVLTYYFTKNWSKTNNDIE